MAFVTAVVEETDDDATFTEADIEREPGMRGAAQQPVRRQEADAGPRWAGQGLLSLCVCVCACVCVQGPLSYLLLPSCQVPSAKTQPLKT